MSINTSGQQNLSMFTLFGEPTGDKDYILRIEAGIKVGSFTLFGDPADTIVLTTGSGWNASATLKLIMVDSDSKLQAQGGSHPRVDGRFR